MKRYQGTSPPNRLIVMLFRSKSLLRLVFVVIAIATKSPATAQTILHQSDRDGLPEYFLKLAKANYPVALPTLMPTNLSRIGDVGEFRQSAGRYTFRCSVLQQIEAGTLFYFKMDTVVEQYNARTNEITRTPGSQDHGPHLLVGDRYKTLADNAVFVPEGTWEIKGTYQYKTLVGSTATAWRIEPVDLSDVEIPLDARLLTGKPRKWSDRSGKFTTEAIYLGYERGTVRLLTSDGEELDVKLTSISESDRRFVRKQIAAEKAAAAKRPDPDAPLPMGHPDRK